ncbi:MAG: hypothetical protein HDQ98_17405 [Lachnospiraceae bacterium]|nr:hypothetical protein [Lachnospiraceae bacterium]
MDTNGKRIPRTLKRSNGSEIGAEELLKDKYEQIFNRYLERVGVIDIQTTYNDYKKLHDDMYELAVGWGKEIVSFSESTDILDLIKMKGIRKACKNKGILEREILLNILKVCDILICFLELFQIVYLFAFKGEYLLPAKIVLPILSSILFVAILIPIILMTKKRNGEILKILDEMDEDKLISIYACIGHNGSLLKDEGIYFIENFSKLDKNCRSYIIAYLSYKEYNSQMWCVFDYLFEKSNKINLIKDKVLYEFYRLIPLKYDQKEAIYKEYNLQRDIDKEYLNCIGVDILWGYECSNITGNFRFHSLDYIKEKIDAVRKGFDPDGGLTKVFYCLVYMSSKYKYSFSINQIISLVLNEEKVNKDLYNLICEAGNRIFNGCEKGREEIRSFFNKILDVLDGYYFMEYKREGGRKVKKYKFSYDILECFQEKMNAAYPDEETVRRWILVKLIGNMDLFGLDRYFFDCSNLLIMSDFLEDNEFCILSFQLLRMLNTNNCGLYYGPILGRLRLIDERTGKKYLQTEVVKSAAINNMFYISDTLSMECGIYFSVSLEGGSVCLDDFTLDTPNFCLSEMEKFSSKVAEYFKLLYKTFSDAVCAFLKFSKIYEAVCTAPFETKEYFPNIIEKLIMLAISCSSKFPPDLDFDLYDKSIREQLKQLKGCSEAKLFGIIIEEILLWVRSEWNRSEEAGYRNVNVGMLIETSNSNMLYFIYGLLNMAIVKDREIVYKNKNPLLNFISQSVFYFRIVARGRGIVKYVNDLLEGNYSTDLKLSIAINLLIRDNPCIQPLKEFIIEHMDKTESLFLSQLVYQDTIEKMERYIGSLLLYNANINCIEFERKILESVSKYLTEIESFNSSRISKFLEIMLEKKYFDEECIDIVDEINEIDSPEFSIWVLFSYCQAREEMLERIPQIDPNILVKSGSNIGLILMAKYLKKHNYYDCSIEILELYLDQMRSFKYPNQVDAREYLEILDQYAVDNRSIKENEFETYNYMLSLLLFYMAVEMSEQKDLDEILLRKTLEFVLLIYRGLKMNGMRSIVKEKYISSLISTDATRIIKRDQRIEELIAERFIYLEPVVESEGKICLLEDYFFMISYLYFVPDESIQLIKQANDSNKEIIKKKHMLYLVERLIHIQNNSFLGLHMKSLHRVKDVLQEWYDIQY